jgi:hypothetical protein
VDVDTFSPNRNRKERSVPIDAPVYCSFSSHDVTATFGEYDLYLIESGAAYF